LERFYFHFSSAMITTTRLIDRFSYDYSTRQNNNDVHPQRHDSSTNKWTITRHYNKWIPNSKQQQQQQNTSS